MIDINKKYRTISGKEVIIYAIYDNIEEPQVHGAVKDGMNWSVESWTLDGNYFEDREESKFDLIEISPYADFKIDDKVLVWNETSTNKVRRHFAGINKSGFPKAWYATGTSFTETSTTTWQNCIKYEEQNDKT